MSNRDGAGGARILGRGAVWPVLLLGFLVGANAPAHPTAEMLKARLAVHTWANGFLNRDMETMASILDPELTTDGGQNREQYLENLHRGMHKITHVWLRFAHFQEVGDTIRVHPVLVYRSHGVTKPALTLTLRRRDSGWKIVHIGSERRPDLPPELAVHNPEQQPLHLVRVHLRDRDSGAAVAARVRVLDMEGTYWPPQGHQWRVPIGWREDVGGDVVVMDETFAYVHPDFILPLAAGSYEMEILKGIEYEPREIRFSVKKGQVPELEVQLRRWSNLQREGWYSGDTHVHFVSPHAALLEAKAEDLNVINILATKWDELITNVEHFTGGPDRVSEPETVIYVNEESRHDFLGHTVLLNLKSLVYPLTWGGPDEGVPGGIDYPPMAHQADKAHAQGGFVSWAHFPGARGELPIDVALGKVDSIDLMTWGDPLAPRRNRPAAAEIWYRFLNCGFRLAAAGGTDKMSNIQVAGIPRVYVQVPGPFSYDAWLDGIRAGRTFVTTGPMLQFSVGGHEVGETISASAGKEIEVTASVRSRIPVDWVDIVQGGKVVARLENPAGERDLTLKGRIRVQDSSWVAARAYGPELVYQGGIPLVAHTSPIYLQVGDRKPRSPEDAAFFLTWIDEALTWLEETANIPDPDQRQEMRNLFEEAKGIYEKMRDRG